jgi:endothelin-converting enzyme/putative endopeptidase
MRQRMITGPAAALVLACASLAGAAEPAKSVGGWSPASLDTSVAPCDDFFQFACGGWNKANPIPDDQSRWGTFNVLADRNRDTLKQILTEATAAGAAASPVQRQIGDFYATCMDEPAVEKTGAAAVKPELDRVAAVKTKAELPALVAHLHAAGTGAFFGFGSEQDFKDATRVLAITGQGGLGLPDRDYYFRDDPKSKELREKYAAHVERMFALLGDAPAVAKKNAAGVLAVETALAKGALDVVSQRDPQKIYHLMSGKDFAALAPGFAMEAYLKGIGAPAVNEINVTEPDFLKALDGVVAANDIDTLKTYLRWHVAHDAAPFLSSAFVNENFEFFGKTLTGAKELRPRWKRCVDATDTALGEALGQAFVDRTFGPEGKKRMKEMVGNLEAALRADIGALPWMTPVTKGKAVEKLNAIANKVGYPDTWRDYGSVKIVRGDLAGNVARANAFELARQLAKIGKPVNRGEFTMTPPTVNAYYNPLLNDVNFPVGILQPPFFDLTKDDGLNYGAIGSVIGHELTHGFDDQGRQFAANGNLADWWTEADAKEFETRAQCVVDQYGGYVVDGDLKQNGQLTLGENVADNGGVRIAYMALLESLKNQQAQKIDGFTPEQRFFLGWSQVWCAQARIESERLQAQTDPHSLPKFRVNGVVGNMPEFQKAFACPATAPMVRGDKACRVW